MQARSDKVHAHMNAQRAGRVATFSKRHLYQKEDFVFWHSDAIPGTVAERSYQLVAVSSSSPSAFMANFKLHSNQGSCCQHVRQVSFGHRLAGVTLEIVKI